MPRITNINMVQFSPQLLVKVNFVHKVLAPGSCFVAMPKNFLIRTPYNTWTGVNSGVAAPKVMLPTPDSEADWMASVNSLRCRCLTNHLGDVNESSFCFWVVSSSDIRRAGRDFGSRGNSGANRILLELSRSMMRRSRPIPSAWGGTLYSNLLDTPPSRELRHWVYMIPVLLLRYILLSAGGDFLTAEKDIEGLYNLSLLMDRAWYKMDRPKWRTCRECNSLCRIFID